MGGRRGPKQTRKFSNSPVFLPSVEELKEVQKKFKSKSRELTCAPSPAGSNELVDDRNQQPEQVSAKAFSTHRNVSSNCSNAIAITSDPCRWPQCKSSSDPPMTTGAPIMGLRAYRMVCASWRCPTGKGRPKAGSHRKRKALVVVPPSTSWATASPSARGQNEVPPRAMSSHLAPSRRAADTILFSVSPMDRPTRQYLDRAIRWRESRVLGLGDSSARPLRSLAGPSREQCSDTISNCRTQLNQRRENSVFTVCHVLVSVGRPSTFGCCLNLRKTVQLASDATQLHTQKEELH